MKGIALAVLVLALSGCARYNIEPPTTDYTSTFEPMEMPEFTVAEIPESPPAKSVNIDGETHGAFDKEGMDALLLMRERARNNTEMLKEMMSATQAIVDERNNLLELAIEIEKRSNRLAEEWADTEEQRRKSEDIRTLERGFYQMLTIIGIGILL